MNRLKVGGFIPTSLVNYTNKVASVVFLKGCNLECPYCHNKELCTEDDEVEMSPDDLMQVILQRAEFIDGVVFTGGEPSLYVEALKEFITVLKGKTKLSIKVDTNGLKPEIFEELSGLVDHWAVDLKGLPTAYEYVLGSKRTASEIDEILTVTRNYLNHIQKENSGVTVEYRTTMWSQSVYEPDIDSFITNYLPERADWYLQRAVVDDILPRGEENWTKDRIVNLTKKIQETRPNTYFRVY